MWTIEHRFTETCVLNDAVKISSLFIRKVIMVKRINTIGLYFGKMKFSVCIQI